MIITYDELPRVRQEVGGEPVFLKGGTFDLLHPGHEQMLSFLKSLGGVSVVGVSPDLRVKSRKGPGRPINNQFERANDVDATGLVDFTFIVPAGVMGLPRAIYKLRPDAFVEHRLDSSAVSATRTLLKLAGVSYVTSDQLRICSTSEIIANGLQNKRFVAESADA